MTYTIEDVKRLVPEAELRNIVELIVIVCGEKPGSRIEADLAYALLTTRRQLEIAREALEYIYEVNAGDPVSQAKKALDAINKEGES